MKQRIMVVDDDPDMRRFLGALLRLNFEVLEVSSGEECLSQVESFQPHVVLLDISMPGMDGYQTCRQLKQPEDLPIQVLMLTGASSEAERHQAYQQGADNYLAKPVNPQELLFAIRLHLKLYDALAALMQSNEELERLQLTSYEMIHERDEDVFATQEVALLALAKLADSRDCETGEHLLRVRHYSRLLAEQLSLAGPYADQVDEQFVDDLYRSCPLHDIGKVGVSDSILQKPGRLTAEEFERMKDHVKIGAQTLEQILEMSPSASFLKMAATIAREHHERFDGRGYPAGLKGEEISLPARIVALADVYDALTSDRVYKKAYKPQVAYEMIVNEAGGHFDPVIVEAFQQVFPKLSNLPREIRDPELPLESLVKHATKSKRPQFS